MAKKNTTKAQRKKVFVYGLSVAIIIIGIIILALGAAKLISLDLDYKRGRNACDDRDYSSYIKKTEIETPGNEEINNQIRIYKNAMQNAADAGDTIAFGQLMQEYNRLLALQGQTKTMDTLYDYSEVEKARNRCYSLVSQEKSNNQAVGIILSSIGGIILVIGIIIGIILPRQLGKKH